jgi:hypothetical protein
MLLHSAKVAAVAALGFISTILCGCDSGALQDAIDLAGGVPEKTIDTDTLGANAFANDGRFGSPAAQLTEVRRTLGLRFVRLLIAWDDNLHPSKSAPLNLSFADTIIGSIPNGVDALIVLTSTPSWMSNPTNWDGGDPRATFVKRFLTPVVTRYADNPRVVGFQVFNEPNQPNPHNDALQITSNATLYTEMLKNASAVIRSKAPTKLVVSAATTAINQNYPISLNYNRAMRDAGAQEYADIWAIHFYGRQYENVLRSGGVADFANGLSLPIWVTESGEQGVTKQLKYGRQTWPFLKDKIPAIERIYLYQFAEETPPESTYGLKNLSRQAPLSDLYIHLRSRAR